MQSGCAAGLLRIANVLVEYLSLCVCIYMCILYIYIYDMYKHRYVYRCIYIYRITTAHTLNVRQNDIIGNSSGCSGVPQSSAASHGLWNCLAYLNILQLLQSMTLYSRSVLQDGVGKNRQDVKAQDSMSPDRGAAPRTDPCMSFGPGGSLWPTLALARTDLDEVRHPG